MSHIQFSGKALVIDHGNTLTKFTLFESGTITTHKASKEFAEHWIEYLPEWCGKPDAVLWTATGRSVIRLKKTIKRVMPGVKLWELTHSTPNPIRIYYDTPHTLGLDRIAAAAGAAALFPGRSMMIVDAGTAVTLDVVDAEGSFRGGNISAGVELRLKALHSYTSALPEVQVEGELPALGRDTTTALRCGAVFGTAAEIVMTAVRCRAMYGCEYLLLTGGSASDLKKEIEEIMAGLPEAQRLQLVSVPSLVAQGLLSIYNYNETNR